METTIFKVGTATVVKVPELELKDFTLSQLLPALDPKVVEKHPDWIDCRTYDIKTARVHLSVHTWVIRLSGKVILIDTGVGNDKDRPGLKALDHLNNPFLQRLAQAGVQPEEVDYILLTHIHADHVGWNTFWNGNKWIPTFPNATVICSELEWRYGVALTAVDENAAAAIRADAGIGDPVRLPTPGVFRDSMMPIEEAGRLRRVVANGSEVLEGIRFISSPGHSVDHASISLVSNGEEAVFGGDITHHPFELHRPDIVSMFCEFPDAARRSRQKIARHVAESGALYFSSHFPASSVGRITFDEESFNWQFVE